MYRLIIFHWKPNQAKLTRPQTLACNTITKKNYHKYKG